MSLWILDTDHVSLFFAGNESVITSVAEYSDIRLPLFEVLVEKL